MVVFTTHTSSRWRQLAKAPAFGIAKQHQCSVNFYVYLIFRMTGWTQISCFVCAARKSTLPGRWPSGGWPTVEKKSACRHLGQCRHPQDASWGILEAPPPDGATLVKKTMRLHNSVDTFEAVEEIVQGGMWEQMNPKAVTYSSAIFGLETIVGLSMEPAEENFASKVGFVCCEIDLSAVASHRPLTVLLMCLSRCKDNEASGRISYLFHSSGSSGRLSACHGARKVRTVMLQLQIVPLFAHRNLYESQRPMRASPARHGWFDR